MSFEPGGLWDFLKNKVVEDYEWKKEEREFANCYVCYHSDKEIGFIPVEYDSNDKEWVNWWEQAYKRNKGLTINVLMKEIMERHKDQKNDQQN